MATADKHLSKGGKNNVEKDYNVFDGYHDGYDAGDSADIECVCSNLQLHLSLHLQLRMQQLQHLQVRKLW